MADAELYRQILASGEHVDPVKIVWSIKGYHAFHLRPHPDIPLKVIAEENNQYDPQAMTVVAPPLCEISERLHDAVTRPGDHNRSAQSVHQIAGKTKII